MGGSHIPHPGTWIVCSAGCSTLGNWGIRPAGSEDVCSPFLLPARAGRLHAVAGGEESWH